MGVMVLGVVCGDVCIGLALIVGRHHKKKPAEAGGGVGLKPMILVKLVAELDVNVVSRQI